MRRLPPRLTESTLSPAVTHHTFMEKPVLQKNPVRQRHDYLSGWPERHLRRPRRFQTARMVK